MEINWTGILIAVFSSGALVSLIDFIRERNKAEDKIPSEWAAIATRLTEDIENERRRREEDIAQIRAEADAREASYKIRIKMLTEVIKKDADKYMALDKKFHKLRDISLQMKRRTDTLLIENRELRQRSDKLDREKVSMLARIANLEAVLRKYGLGEPIDAKQD